MNVVVTGGAGFIGSHLVDRLLADGHAVTVLDNLSTGRAANLAAHLGHPRLRFLRGSILDATLVDAVMSGTDVVYHLAAAVGVGHVVKDPLWTAVTNAHGTEIVLEHARARGARVVFASTSEIYGTSDALPYREDGPRVLGPTWIHRWSYSTAKALGEHLCFAHAERGLAVSIVRYFNTYGPRMDPAGYGSVVARFVSQALDGAPLTVHGDGAQARCFTFVSETVDATVRAGTLDAAIGQVFNVGSPFHSTIGDLARLIIELTGSGSTVTHIDHAAVYGEGFADTRTRVPDVSKIAARLGWQPTIPLREGLARVIAERRASEAR
ncbi:NAD-dependent dehydratase [bacterium]|nr:NAD-dependent epimerase/dehydratase family protein [Chloroflexi bacterium CFX6]RIL12665.1 MAG: NAD-dependent dehydratase [bacterium]